MSGEREGIASMGKRCADRRWPIFQAFGRRQPTVRSTRLRSRKIIERERHALCLRGLPVARLRDRSHPAEPIRLACGSPAAPDPEAVSIERRSSTTPRICMRSNRPTCSPREHSSRMDRRRVRRSARLGARRHRAPAVLAWLGSLRSTAPGAVRARWTPSALQDGPRMPSQPSDTPQAALVAPERCGKRRAARL